MKKIKDLNFLIDDKIYSNIDDILYPEEWELIKTQKKIEYYNIPCAFDIETTSFIDNGEKCAIMYEWTFGINGRVVTGRTWDEFIDLINHISEVLDLSESKRLICYIHNAGFEFQFMKEYFEWVDVFAVKERKPVKFICSQWIEFKCSYMLSGYSLANLGKQLNTYKVLKKENDLNYSLIRHSGTYLSETELQYCVYDVLVVMAYIQEKIEYDGNITKIPLTKTGYVRRALKKNCLYASGNHKKNKWKYVRYHKLMKSLTIELDEYHQLKRAFQGGFTHTSCLQANKVLNDVGSIDFTSSYPYALISSRQFPMSKGHLYDPKDFADFEKQLMLYCCLFDVEIIGLCAKKFTDHPLSLSRCYNVKESIVDNGRIVSASHLITTWTEQDYYIMKEYYEWEHIGIKNFRRYYKGYLPTDFVKTVLSFYKSKTELKNVKGREGDYLAGKELLNSCYGACVTDICRDKQVYKNGKWYIEPADVMEELNKYNEAKGRVLFYPWGVWCTAIARRNLFTGISEFDTDYCYADTDSIKAINMDKHERYINAYNEDVERKLKKAMYYHKIDFSECKPKTIKGEEKLIGVWDFEGTYDKAKFLGAKRYMVYEDGEYNITVSGLNKKTAVPYLINQKKDPFNLFNNDMYIPPEYTGKNTHTYIDVERHGLITDYLGNTAEYHAKSGIHLEACDFTLSLAAEYMDFLLGIQEEDEY